jgi:hypothetical protein
MKDKINKICTELNDGKIAVVQATEQLFDLYSVMHPLPIDYEKEFKKMNQLGQSQIDTNSQLKILSVFANKLGLYDAADNIRID